MPPLAVRVQVAERQMRADLGIQMFRRMDYAEMAGRGDSLGKRLKFLLDLMFVAPHLDHDPALILRPYNPRIKDVASRYIPHAHDPAALIYREKANHQQKTTGRKPGAVRTVTTKGSDIGLKTKFARLARKNESRERVASFFSKWERVIKATPSGVKIRPKAKIAQRKNPWPKRKMRNG